MVEIMWRLPVKSLLRFKCVCKNWYSLIQSFTFINDHYNHPNNRTRLLVHYLQKEYHTSQFTLFSDETLTNTIAEDIVNPLTRRNVCFHNIMGPVNGLFLVNYGQLALWNPATTEFRQLPLPTSDVPPIDSVFGFSFGFGFDPLTGDFKVVRIPYSGNDRLLVQLYSLGSDSWRRINSASLVHILRNGGFFWRRGWDNMYLNGAYYWLSLTRPTIILFDMRREVFREIQTPPSFRKELSTNYNQDCQLLLYNNSIALLETRYANAILLDSIHVWYLMIKGEEYCWTKHSIVRLPLIPEFRFLGFWMNGEILLYKHKKYTYHSRVSKLVFYNPNNLKILDLGTRWKSIEVLNYKASLASVKGGRKLCQTS